VIGASVGRQNSRQLKALGRREGHSEGQVLELRNVDGRLHVARKERRPDEWDPPIPVYDPYGPGDSHDFDVIT
jgi:hypothetical protein